VATRRKALFEALIVDIETQADDSVIPRFRIPTGNNGEGLTPREPTLDQLPADSTVRVLPHRVELRGLEPLTPHCQERAAGRMTAIGPAWHVRRDTRSSGFV